MEHEKEIRGHLEKVMPTYCERSCIAAEKLAECCLSGE